MAEAQAGPTIFASVHFQIILSSSLSAQRAAQLRDFLLEHGAAEHAPPSATGTSEFTGLTHIITETIDFANYNAADDRMIAIVNVSWVNTSVLKRRLANPKSHSPDPRMFFSGLVVCTADLPEGDKDAIIGGVLAMGGLYSSSISKLVTHVVALDMQPQACQSVLAKGFKCKIVLPQWFDDCLRLGKCISEAPYVLPDPAILKMPIGSVGTAIQPDLKGAMNPEAPVEVPSSAPEAAEDAIFDGKSFVLAGDLAINDHLRESISTVIKKAGGRLCDVVDDCDVFIGHCRHGHGYHEAYSAGKTIGNLPWLYWMVSRNRWTSPLLRLLHYPIPHDGLAGTRGLRLCLSNYNGEARIYLENLAKAAGCEFTKTLKNDNTHLITAHTQSEKCDAAREWGIHLVNHLWLEESYARCHIQSPSNPRYTHFPPHTNLTEVVGQTAVDRTALEAQFRGGLQAPAKVDEPASIEPNKASSSPIKALAQRNRIGQVDKCKETPVRKMAGKENEIPTPTTGSRSAKAKATERLQNLGPDMLLYEKEKKRVGGVIYGGRRKLHEERAERKRSFSDTNMSEDDDGVLSSKRVKPLLDPPRLRLLVTGVPKYSGQDKASARLRDQLRALGVLITESEHNCKYLVAPRILRTRKFLCAIAQAPLLVDPSFLDACIDANQLLDPDEYQLNDPSGEAAHNIKLKSVLHKAAKCRGKMLRGRTIWATREVPGGYESYAAIIEANGGKCLPFQGRAGSIPTVSAGSDSDDDGRSSFDTAYLISGRTDLEQALWQKFRQLASEAGREPMVVETDWILNCALRQEMNWLPTDELIEIIEV